MSQLRATGFTEPPIYFTPGLAHGPSMAALLPPSPRVDEDALVAWLVNWEGWGRLFSGLDVLRPGEMLQLEAGGIGRRAQTIPAPRSAQWLDEPVSELATSLRNHLVAAVQRAVGSSRKVAVAVGGSDSTAVLAAARQLLPAGALHAITLPAVDEVDEDPDLPYVTALCQHLDVSLVSLPWRTRELVDALLVDARPCASPYLTAERAMAQHAVDAGCDVLLTGVGGDLVFGGALEELGHRLAAKPQEVLRALRIDVPWPTTLRSRVSWLAHVHRPASSHRKPRPPSWVGPSLRRAWSEAHRPTPAPTRPAERLAGWYTSEYVLSMAHHGHAVVAGMPIRHCDPTMDPELLQFLASVPIEALNCDARFRGLLHRAIAPWVPRRVAERRTKSFVDPFKRLPPDAHRYFADLASARELGRRGLVEGGPMRAMLDRGEGLALWRLFAAEAWLRRYA